MGQGEHGEYRQGQGRGGKVKEWMGEVFLWVHRSAESIFGAASNPVNQNEAILAFDDEGSASSERDRLSASSGGSHLRYTVERRMAQFETTPFAVAVAVRRSAIQHGNRAWIDSATAWLPSHPCRSQAITSPKRAGNRTLSRAA